MKLQQLMSYTRKAIDDYSLIDEGDRIAVGVSGGKDSLTLLAAMQGLMRFYPNHFELMAVTVDLGFDGFDLTPVTAYCDELGVRHEIVHSDIGQIIFEDRQEKNPCSLCAKMRKGALNQAVKDLGYNKVAYAHHKDDLVETMLLSLIFEGRFYCFPPKTYLDRMDLTVIRPLMYVEEAEVKGFAKQYDLPVVKNPCPADGVTRREYAKQLVRDIDHESPGAKARLFTAITQSNIPGWNRV
ncbi:MAG: tRNA 2-thiocytidine(32) synthetase TtcA [Clostridiales bacterium]|nr:tRNA 2-thiocytidine(32) synthetase TtcA [Clostridiales bacterium]